MRIRKRRQLLSSQNNQSRKERNRIKICQVGRWRSWNGGIRQNLTCSSMEGLKRWLGRGRSYISSRTGALLSWRGITSGSKKSSKRKSSLFVSSPKLLTTFWWPACTVLMEKSSSSPRMPSPPSLIFMKECPLSSHRGKWNCGSTLKTPKISTKSSITHSWTRKRQFGRTSVSLKWLLMWINWTKSQQSAWWVYKITRRSWTKKASWDFWRNQQWRRSAKMDKSCRTRAHLEKSKRNWCERMWWNRR